MKVGAGRRGGGEKQMVPEAEFSSYYGRPVLKETVWGPDIPAYLFLGGLAGASSALAAAAQLSGHPELARASKAGAAGAISLSMVALVHDLGRPARFINMLRVLKVTSPMSVGTWILSGYTPLALGAAASAVTGKLPRAGPGRHAARRRARPRVASYTSVLLPTPRYPPGTRLTVSCRSCSPDPLRAAAGGLGMLAVRPDGAAQAVEFGVLGAAAELTAKRLLLRRLGPAAEPYQKGRAGAMMKASEVLTIVGLAGAVLAGRNRAAAALSGAALMAASALTRFGVFEAGRAGARDPKYTVGPQRQRLARTGRAGQLTASGQGLSELCIRIFGVGRNRKLTGPRRAGPRGKQGHEWPGRRGSADVAGRQAPG